MSIETKKAITFEEFRAWMEGLVRGKNGALPGLEDWKKIKMMMDKVQPERVEVPVPVPSTTPEPIFPNFPDPSIGQPIWIAPTYPGYPQPYVGDVIPNPFEITCDGTYGTSAINSFDFSMESFMEAAEKISSMMAEHEAKEERTVLAWHGHIDPTDI